MTLSKRLFDIALSLLLMVLLSPVIACIGVLIWLRDGSPVFYVSERMKTDKIAFSLIKFRTMSHATSDSGVSGGDKSGRITRTGRFLRRTRLDELPQLWNILRGDMSFVGPRPPLRTYVERFPDLYADVLKCRPGVTGLATLIFHRHEEMLLAPCKDAETTDEVYARRCVPRKARLDMIYAARRSFCFDLFLVFQTVRKLLKRG
ncbi:sugar transferase [Celeribacter arenosi]|uniref:Sugar transferase n=1 Tax=Celeribacter arenosi TaxID=792649 RepID=A0ABP7JZ46_9RHOB